MSVDIFTWIGIAGGAITSVGFIPQLFRGYKTKRLDDISYWMPLILAFGMFLWLIYGILRNDFAIIIANIFGVGSNLLLILMKYFYSTN